MELKRVDKWAGDKAGKPTPKPVPKLVPKVPVPKPVGKSVVRKVPVNPVPKAGKWIKPASFNPNLQTEIRFKGGPVVNTQNCPRAIHARRHWGEDGRCKCPAGTSGRKWSR